MMDPALGGTDELWLRQVWFARLRWIIPPAVVALGFSIEGVSRQRLFPTVPVLLLAGALLALNVAYRALLGRWAAATEAHARPLAVLAHVQVLGDLVIATLAMHFAGGAKSTFWPFISLTVMAAALLFARRSFIILYASVAALLCWIDGVATGGGWLPTTALQLAALLAMVALICTFYSERMAESRAMVRNKDEILSRVTHELRTPLSALRGFVYLARKRGDETPNTQLGQTLTRIDVQVDRLARMVSDLYDASAVQAGKLQLEPRACDLVAIVRELALRFRTVHPKLDLRWSGPEVMWGQWDAARIDQLLSNLIGNAVKYAGETSVVEVTLTPSSGGSAHVQVHDEGPGIPADKLAMIFEPFQRIDDSGAKKGLGLGLSIAREIALLHGGAIWVDSAPGRGATFHVRLPTGGIRAPS
jgi:signal transduction histidine kinase